MDAAQLRPLAVGEILDLAIKVYRERFTHLVKAVAVVVAPVAVLRALVQVSIVPDEGDGLLSGPVDATGAPTLDAGEVWSLLGGLLLIGLVSLVSSQLATGASFKLVSGAYLDERPDWRESLRFAAARLGSLVWLTILFGFLVGLGFLACIVPGVYFYVAWAVAVPALLLEDVRGRRALRRSRDLVRERWWPTVGVLLVAFFLAAVVQAMISALLLVVVGVGDNDVVVAVAQAVTDTVGTVLTTPFTAAVVAVVYFDLRVRKEGFDLELLAHRVGVEPPAGVPTGPGAPTRAAGDEGDRPPFWPPPPGWAPGGGRGDPPLWPPPPGWSPPGSDPEPPAAPPPAGEAPDGEDREPPAAPPGWGRLDDDR
ncbi:MAG: hypothetical protein ACLGIO_10540 [Acidimicrobiia bacterium]